MYCKKTKLGTLLIISIVVLLCAVLLCAVLTTTLSENMPVAEAVDAHEHIYDSGVCTVCGAKLIYWEVTADNKLIISTNESEVNSSANRESGTFASNDVFGSMSSVPWYGYRSNITQVQVTGDVCPTSTAYWFYSFNNAISFDLSGLDTSNVTDMRSMFINCATIKTLDLSHFNTEKVGETTNGSFLRMFDGCSSLKLLDLSSFTITRRSPSVSVSRMLEDCPALDEIVLPTVMSDDVVITLPGTFFSGGKDWTVASSVTVNKRLVRHDEHNFVNGVCSICSALDPNADFIYWCLHQIDGGYELYLGNSDFSSNIKNTSYYGFFSTNENVVPWGGGATISMGNIRNVVIQSVIKPKFTDGWFSGFGYVTEMDLSNLDMSEVTSMNEMFEGCVSLQSIRGMDQWDTSKVTSMSCMFDHCGHLTSLDLSNFNTDNVNNFNEILSGHSGLMELKLFDVNLNASCDLMFSDCTQLNKITFKNIYGDANKSIELPSLYFDGKEVVRSVNTTHSNKTLIRHEVHSVQLEQRKDATCTQDGHIAYWQCEVCGKYFSDENAYNEITDKDSVTLPALGHDYGDWEITKEATCTEAGSKRHVCANDGEHVETEVIPALGHNYGDWEITKQATCTEAGSKRHVCANDGEHVETEVIPALGHTVVTDSAVAPTCTQTGKTEGKHCSVCNTVLVEQTTVAALGHSYGEWTVTKEPTVDEYGEEQRVCSRDGHVEKRQIEKLSAPESQTAFIILIVVLVLIIAGEVSYLIYYAVRKNRTKGKKQ